MQRRSIAIFVSGTMCLSLASAASAVDPAGLFEELYGAEARRVRATLDRADDVAFAQKMMDTSRTVTDAPQFQIVLLEQALEFASRDVAGHALAIQAADRLIELQPARRAELDDKAAQLLRLGYLRSRGPQREEAARAYVQRLTASAERVAQTDAAEAVKTLRQALIVAAHSNLPEADALRARIERLTAESAARAKVTRLLGQLEVDASDRDAARALIDLYVIEMDDPAAAKRYVPLTGDDVLVRRVQAAAGGVAAAPKDAALDLGAWYGELADRAPTHARPAMLKRALTAYHRFLALHAEQDAARLRATLAVGQLEQELAKLGVDNTFPGAAATPVAPDPVPQPAAGPAPAEPQPKAALDNVGPTIEKLAIQQDLHLTQTGRPYIIKDAIVMTSTKERYTITVAPGVEVRGGTIDLKTRATLLIQGTAEQPVVFRDVRVIADLHGALKAEHAIFENCTFRKGGVWFSAYSSKWAFDHCLLHRCTFPPFSRVNYSVKFTHCMFTYIKWSEVEKPYRTSHRLFDTCTFAGCTVPPSIGWCADKCNFYACTFPVGKKYDEPKPLTCEPYILKYATAHPRDAWTISDEGAAAVTVTPAEQPYPVDKLKVKPPIVEIRGDRELLGLVAE